jgi:hypothetical protein
MSDIFEGYIDWSLNKRFGGAPSVEGEQQEAFVPAETIPPKQVNQPEYTKPAPIVKMIAEGLDELKSDVENKPVESAYGMAKGAVQGTIGAPGDIVSIAKGIYYATQTPEGKSKVEEFIKGMESATGLPTSEDVQKFLNKLIPSGPLSTEAAGEIVSIGKAISKIGKSAIKNKAKTLVGATAVAAPSASKEKAKQ